MNTIVDVEVGIKMKSYVELKVYLKDKKFSFIADKKERFNVFFEQLFNNDARYVEYNDVCFDKNQFRLYVIKEKRRRK